MTKEPLDNIRIVSSLEAPKAGAFIDVSTKSLIGRNVKISFNSKSGNFEHMWVYILSAHPCDPHAMIGKLDNYPVIATQYKYGQTIVVKTCQIEQIL